jgi:hypothetical protein
VAGSSFKISVKDKRVLSGVVHGSVWRQGDFRWEPSAFVIESPRLDNKIVEASVQVDSYNMFVESPNAPMVYVVCGNPDDSKAKYFAAHLAYLHHKKFEHRADIHWEAIFGGFENALIKKDIEPTMLILSNLAENSTSVKIEKARDLIERFPNIPRIVVCCGEDPMSFASTKLYTPAHGIAYFSSSLVKAVQEIY